MHFKENEQMLKQFPRVFDLKLIHHIYSTIVPTQKGLAHNLSTILNQLSVTQAPGS